MMIIIVIIVIIIVVVKIKILMMIPASNLYTGNDDDDCESVGLTIPSSVIWNSWAHPPIS